MPQIFAGGEREGFARIYELAQNVESLYNNVNVDRVHIDRLEEVIKQSTDGLKIFEHELPKVLRALEEIQAQYKDLEQKRGNAREAYAERIRRGSMMPGKDDE